MSDNIIEPGHGTYQKLIKAYNVFCKKMGVVPSVHPAYISFWLLENGSKAKDCYPGEISESETYIEGASTTIKVNAYERNKEARRACIAHYKNNYNCEICGFNFEKTYGQLGKGYIHVHHLKPLSSIKEEYRVNPKIDLIPVCANCHALIHRDGENVLAPNEIKCILAENSKKR
jgi:5-methylcytosine-specific restriction protein A